MLTPLDESLLHQAPTTFDHATTSDHRFFDRWAVGVQDASASVIYGVATYKNTDACDGFVCVQVGDRQVNLRVSRPLRPDWSMRIGPLEILVEEPLTRHRLVVGDHPGSPIRADLTWTAEMPPREESPHFLRRHGRAQADYCRFDQLGMASGWVAVGEEVVRLDGSFAWRDHSWGVRPGMGGPDPVAAREAGEVPSHLGSLFIWLAFRAGPCAGQFQLRQAADGAVEHLDGHVLPDLADPSASLAVTGLTHDLTFADGLTALMGARLEAITADGRTWPIRAVPLRPPWVFEGAGYSGGWADGAGLGVFRGHALETDEYRLTGPADVGRPDGSVAQPWHREHDVTLEVAGHRGAGHLTVIARAPLPPARPLP